MITFVCGQICCGKSIYAKALANSSTSFYATWFEVGDIVRKIKQDTAREALQDSKDLVDRIILTLKGTITTLTRSIDEDIIICGARQKQILEAFPEATLIWVDCPKPIRERRYTERARKGDDCSFEEAEQGDINLGILEVKQYILNRQ
jgi:hypothetical protein